MSDERRAFVRHPASAPIQVFPQQQRLEQSAINDISNGGLAFRSNVCLDEGETLKIRIPHVDPPFEAVCVVRWRRQLEGDHRFEIGVMFLDEQARFRARMVEQICHILQFQQQQAEIGRIMDFETAARLWISEHAAGFGGC